MAARRNRRTIGAHADDSELHVDVMRFFAIIAMCLFAILPNTEVPNAQQLDGHLQQAALADLNKLPVSNANAGTEQSQLKAEFLQRLPPVKTVQPYTSTDQGMVHSIPSTEKSVVEDVQRLSVSKVASTALSRSEQQPPAGLASKREQYVRFLDSDAFTLAVLSGAISLVHHNQNESLVFDPAVSRFTRLVDTSLQLFELAASEVPMSFHRALPRHANMFESQWLITLPEPTLAYLFDAKAAQRTEVILNKKAQPIL